MFSVSLFFLLTSLHDGWPEVSSRYHLRPVHMQRLELEPGQPLMLTWALRLGNHPNFCRLGGVFCDNGQFERQFISIELFGMWRQDETGRAFEKGVPIPFGGLGWYLKHLKTVLHVAYYPPYITVLATRVNKGGNTSSHS